ncbi:MAG: DUF2442 domain-containing protein [Defluviitaleaceae bacterium]|nr:DUF2442 domain-containing protein [Defluviitaleaceae bacterium]
MQSDIIHGSPLGPRVTSIIASEDYTLTIVFNNNEKRIFDAKPLLSLDAFEPLNDNQLFQSATVAYGSVFWPDFDIDYCPDTLYTQSIPVGV